MAKLDNCWGCLGLVQTRAYLPKELNGVNVLVNRGSTLNWQAINDNLKHGTAGLAYRKTKSLDDRMGLHVLAWGAFVEGRDEGDGWVRCTVATEGCCPFLRRICSRKDSATIRRKGSLAQPSMESAAVSKDLPQLQNFQARLSGPGELQRQTSVEPEDFQSCHEDFQSCHSASFDPAMVDSPEATARSAQMMATMLRNIEQQPLSAKAREAARKTAEVLKELEAAILGTEAPAPRGGGLDIHPPSRQASSESPIADIPFACTASSKSTRAFHTDIPFDHTASSKSTRSPHNAHTVLNTLVSALWPRIDKFVHKLIIKTIEPSVNQALPHLIVMGGGVKFTEVSLGDCAPSLGPSHAFLDAKTKAITIRIGVDIRTALKVSLNALHIPLGVENFCLVGDLEVVLAPPLNKPPFFGGLQIYFPNPPVHAVEFCGAARIAHVPGLKGAIRRAIDNAIAGACVLPRRIAMVLDPHTEIDQVDLAYPEPDNIIRFTLWSGSNLPARDTHLLSAASSDPYVTATLGIQSWTSPTIPKSLNPVWGDGHGLIVDFPLHDNRQTLSISVYDSDFLSTDDLMGWARIKPATALEHQGQEIVELCKPGSSDGAGSLTVSTELLRLSPHRPEEAHLGPLTSGPSEAHLSVKLLTVAGVPFGSQYPFKIHVQVLCPGGNGGQDKVLLEAFSSASHPLKEKQLSEAFQGIARALAASGDSAAKIAEILDIGSKEVTGFLETDRVVGDGGRRQAAARHQAELERLSVKHPRFDQAVQMLLPCGSTKDENLVVLTLIDNANKPLGCSKVPLKRVLQATDMVLQGPFSLGTEKKFEVAGCMRLKWLQPGVASSSGRLWKKRMTIDDCG